MTHLFIYLYAKIKNILRMKALPRWRNLNHFDYIMSLHFSDANKYEDILKV